MPPTVLNRRRSASVRADDSNKVCILALKSLESLSASLHPNYGEAGTKALIFIYDRSFPAV